MNIRIASASTAMALTLGLSLGLALGMTSDSAMAQERSLVEPGEPGPLEAYIMTGDSETCIHVTRIRRTEVIDGQTILFHLGRDRVYMNRLPRSCPGLARERAFSYTIRGSQLCSMDTIRVLEKPIMRTGAACGLGRFELLELRAEFNDEDFEFELDDEAVDN